MEDQLRLIKQKLDEASEAYYNSEYEMISDDEYDDLYSEFKVLSAKYGKFEDAVGAPPHVDSSKVIHKFPSLSLDKTKSKDDIIVWMKKRNNPECIMSWKLDGLTMILTYNHGVLVSAATRGDGQIGEDVTRNAKHMQNVPVFIPNCTDEIIIRGEAVVAYDNFIPDKYKNPRGMAAGLVRTTKKIDIKDISKVKFLPFEVANAEYLGFNKASDALIFLKDQLGFETVNFELVNNEKINRKITLSEGKIEELHYPTDGLVISVNNLELQNELGCTAKFPRYSIAFKWPDLKYKTKLIRVEWHTAESGLITPIAVFEPVKIDGTIVQRATLHNLSTFKSLELGFGDIILVYKSNGVIPQVFSNLTRLNNMPIPSNCPTCSGETEIRVGVNGTTEFLYCLNPKCPEEIDPE